MSAPFKHSAETLFAFLAQPGRGYYIPYYQRPYSWDEENAKKLLEDIFGGVKRTLTKANNSIFLGTVILHDEANVTVGTHTDTPNLVTKVSNVVDGQQRIVSIGLLACTLSHYVGKIAVDLKSSPGSTSEFLSLATELDNQKLDLTELYSIEIKKPRQKNSWVVIGTGNTPSA